MDFKLEFNLDNAALKVYPEQGTITILRAISDQIENGMVENSIVDINGNKVGHWEFTID